MARVHAERHGNLLLVARRKDPLEALKAELEQAHGVSVLVLAEDLTHPNAPGRIHTAVTDAGVMVDYLINNARLGARGLFHEMPWEQMLTMIQVNATALAGQTHAFLPEFVAHKSARVLNVTSTAAEMPGAMLAICFATKGFAVYLGNAVVEELSCTKITVANFIPTETAPEFAQVVGMADTPLVRKTSSARRVALNGYDAMLRGDVEAYGGMKFERRLMRMLTKIMPKRGAMRAVRKAQEATAS